MRWQFKIFGKTLCLASLSPGEKQQLRLRRSSAPRNLLPPELTQTSSSPAFLQPYPGVPLSEPEKPVSFSMKMLKAMKSFRQAIGTFEETFNQDTRLRSTAARKTQEVLDNFTAHYNEAKASKTSCKLDLDDPDFSFVVKGQKLSIPDVCSDGEVAQKIIDQSDEDSYNLLLEDLTQIREGLGKLASSQRSTDTMESLRLQQLIQASNQLDLMVNTLQNLGFDTSKTFFQNIR